MNLYAYVDNNGLNEIDPFGQSSFTACWKKCIDDNYGKSFSVALDLSYISVVAIIQDVYNGIVEKSAEAKLKNLQLEGANTEGTIIDKMDAAERASNAAKSLVRWKRVLCFLGKASGVIAAGATGYVIGASSYCTGQCAGP